MYEQYQLFTVNDAQSDDAAIIEVLAAITAKKLSNDITLLNYYKEVPISFAATVKEIDRGMVEMGVHQVQAVAMLTQKISFVRSRHLLHDVIAKVQRVKVEKKTAFLTQFSYAQIRSDRRETVRVKLTEKVQVTFETEKGVLEGELNDISLGGLSLLAQKEVGLSVGEVGMVNLWLPTVKLELPGKFLRGIDDNNRTNYMFQLETNQKQQGVISQFINYVQSDIIRELKDRLPSH